MDINEIKARCKKTVCDLRDLLPTQVDYAELVGAEGWSHGACFVWTEPEPYAMYDAARLIVELLSEIERCDAELERYKSLEQDGRLKIWPVPLGTTVYYLYYDHPEDAEGFNFAREHRPNKIGEAPADYALLDGWGDWVFGTLEAAEAALKEKSQ